ncbi:universal stress protein [Mycobacterium kansasii]|uniref:Universal stress protein n=2 Tax=Mycobacterium kansasii TaxID=1768 RepID=A0A1V3WMD6_MYCKA|nr:universal stress protein [Mycobacterium kansasii]EUA00490.1 universal stress protein [Mycobacterium kansasii 824]AGZ49565.1 universal stress protein [Mycobacterium kansasii ATCC 12478]ARG58471.1 universal stress protein [Mycobacterium kansasii]ARG64016.1 universal stress protein [Mycobacterium kansasii]ARG71670.1 universal stress protein [Mycobacterium kansasii]
MNHPQSRIVVGIDGSDAAINAAKWAITEAISRDIPLRLIHAIPRGADVPAGDESLDVEYAEMALHGAAAALHAMDEAVKVETEIVHGSPGGTLIDESRSAAMVCVGSVGIGRVARKLLGSTAEAVARKARCPTAVIRTGHNDVVPDSAWIAVVVEDSPANDAVLEQGFREAHLRGAPILAMGVWRWGLGEIRYEQLNRRLDRWVGQYRDLHVQPAAARHGVAEFLGRTEEAIQLAVVGSDDAGDVARMVGPVTFHVPRRDGHSVLVVPN